ncbi:MAG TPA: protein-disulfide reductase DsbD domain-containing protein [Roseomonas sp.]|nr:protein-disulfide reductase DsbD domain-containing protein [Roseomonas sp.]
MLRAFLPLLAVLSLATPALALESAPVRSERATLTLAAEVDAVAPGQPFRLGLRQVLAPGWHTYWRNAGDAGAPPEITFTAPEGTRTTGFDWPAPQRIPFGPLVNYGYEGHVLLPLTVTPPASLKPGEVFTLEAQANWLVCEQVCVPEEGSFRLDFPVEAAARPDPALAGPFREAEAALPRPSPWPASIGFEGESGGLHLEGTDLTPATVREAFFFPAEPTVLDHAAPQPLAVADGALRLGLTRSTAPLPPGPVAGVVVLTDAAGTRSAYSIAPEPGPVPAALGDAGTGTAISLWQAALLAALGGLILNLMPCVFPILAMKAMALARLSGAARGEVRGHAASYTAGVVLCFLALAGLLLTLRAAGVVAGWGFQFTAPAFVAGMGWLMLAVGLNLSGVFQVGGPVGAGNGLAARGGHLGSFATGALAVLVATPCTAPFMAAAIGAALAMPPAATLAVFAAMGLGMAAPYALLALAPGLAGLLPRPGTWMERLKELLAFPMYGAALWLLWVLAQQVGPEGLAAALAGALGIGFAAWALGVAQRAHTPRGRWVGRAGGALALVAALALLPGLAAAPAPRSAAMAAEDGAEPWSATRLAALRAEGRPIFVNLTAAWCITCKVNERMALNTEAVRTAFARQGIAYLKGDWTDGNATLAEVLRAHGREGVPLYLVYPAGGGAPAVLPQILTESIVLRAIGAAPA